MLLPWTLMVLPFLSACVIATAQPLREGCRKRNGVIGFVGVIGLITFAAGMMGLVPAYWALAPIIIGGVLAGLIFFWSPTRGSDGDDDGWGRPPPPPDDQPPPLGDDDLLIDWDRFDRARAAWELLPHLRR